MKLDTSRFGTLEVDEQTVITFTQPILGFPDKRRYVVLPGPPESGLLWLQSTEDGALAFIIMDPRLVVPDYEVRVKPGELTELAADASDELDVFTLVVVPSDRSKIRTNLRAPILVNPKQRLAKQAILDQSDYPVQYFFANAEDGAKGPKEVSHARSDS